MSGKVVLVRQSDLRTSAISISLMMRLRSSGVPHTRAAAVGSFMPVLLEMSWSCMKEIDEREEKGNVCG
jgi:hypothetical protein